MAQSSRRTDNPGRAFPEAAAVIRGRSLTNHSGHTKTDEEEAATTPEEVEAVAGGGTENGKPPTNNKIPDPRGVVSIETV